MELLTSNERKLCSAMHLIPKNYMVIKDALIRESMKRGYLDPSSASQLVKIEVRKTEAIYDFFVSCGWISSAPPDMP